VRVFDRSTAADPSSLRSSPQTSAQAGEPSARQGQQRREDAPGSPPWAFGGGPAGGLLATLEAAPRTAQLRAMQATMNGSPRVAQLHALGERLSARSSVVVQRTAVIQLRRVFRGPGQIDDDLPADNIGPGGEWYAYTIGAENELVYVHVTHIAELMEAYPQAQLADPEDLREPAEEQGEPLAVENAGLGVEDADLEVDAGGLEDADAVEDVSHILHFQDRRDPHAIVRRSVNPDEVAQEDLAERLTPEPLQGLIIEVRFMSPANPADHFEVVCLVAPAVRGEEPIGLKFDFNRNGYRMILGADPDQNGTRHVVGATRPDAPIRLADATTAFADVASEGGVYREAVNECGTFARSFYARLMGHAPDAEDAEEEEENEAEVVVHPDIPLSNRFAPLADLNDEE
jgi:hypothetical protein